MRPGSFHFPRFHNDSVAPSNREEQLFLTEKLRHVSFPELSLL
jgi:hypothetical protein